MKYFRWVMIAAGLFLSADAVVLSLYSNFTIGLIFTLGIGCLLFLWGVFYKAVQRFSQTGLKKAAKYIIAAGLCSSAALCAFFMVYGNIDTVTYDEDAVIVLGCAVNGTVPTQPLAARLDKAVEYHKKNPNSYIIVSGGQGYQEKISEAECMYNYLAKRGVNADKIIKEQKATSTNENIIYSKELIRNLPDIKDICIITNDFHIFRAKRLAEINGINAASMHAATPWYNAPVMYIREVLAFGQLVLLRR